MSEAQVITSYITPSWKVPPHVSARVSTRCGGVSAAPYDSLNIGMHVGDSETDVCKNRAILMSQLSLPAEPRWLNQEHGNRIVELTRHCSGCKETLTADGFLIREPGVVGAIMTADCLPILFVSDCGREVAGVHAGWKGLANGICDEVISLMRSSPRRIKAWIGPAISQKAFEVGQDVFDTFESSLKGTGDFFQPRKGHSEKYWCDLPGIAEMVLRRAGLIDMTQSGLCTYSRRDQFFSYRRSGCTGRFVSLIWISEP